MSVEEESGLFSLLCQRKAVSLTDKPQPMFPQFMVKVTLFRHTCAMNLVWIY